MQKVTDQSKMDQISTFLERIDEDRDGQLKVDDVLKVIFVVIDSFYEFLFQVQCKQMHKSQFHCRSSKRLERRISN